MPCKVLRRIINAPWKQNRQLMMPRYCTDSAADSPAPAPSTSRVKGTLPTNSTAHAAAQYTHWMVSPARMPPTMRSYRRAPSFCPT